MTNTLRNKTRKQSTSEKPIKRAASSATRVTRQANIGSRVRAKHSSAAGTAAEAVESSARTVTKADRVLGLLYQEQGASLAEICQATGWQVHSVRGFLSGTVRKKLGLTVNRITASDGVSRYHVRTTT